MLLFLLVLASFLRLLHSLETSVVGSYIVVDNESNIKWTTANTFCDITYGTTLISIKSREEENAVEEAMTATGVDSSKVWIGGEDPNMDVNYTWVEDGSHMVYSNWDLTNCTTYNHPNFAGDCVLKNALEGGYQDCGTWITQFCTSTATTSVFICYAPTNHPTMSPVTISPTIYTTRNPTITGYLPIWFKSYDSEDWILDGIEATKDGDTGSYATVYLDSSLTCKSPANYFRYTVEYICTSGESLCAGYVGIGDMNCVNLISDSLPDFAGSGNIAWTAICNNPGYGYYSRGKFFNGTDNPNYGNSWYDQSVFYNITTVVDFITGEIEFFRNDVSQGVAQSGIDFTTSTFSNGIVGLVSMESNDRGKVKLIEWVCTYPTSDPTTTPSSNPTNNPTATPSINPTGNPSMSPTNYPSNNPSKEPSNIPSLNPTVLPSNDPSFHPTQMPTFNPSVLPTVNPTRNPSEYPSAIPSMNPSIMPSSNPTLNPSNYPTLSPSKSTNPTNSPSGDSTVNPSLNPMGDPATTTTDSPTTTSHIIAPNNPTNSPQLSPTHNPTNDPTSSPIPTSDPTNYPSNSPLITNDPSNNPTNNPISTDDPSKQPTVTPIIISLKKDKNSDFFSSELSYVVLSVLSILLIIGVFYFIKRSKNNKSKTNENIKMEIEFSDKLKQSKPRNIPELIPVKSTSIKTPQNNTPNGNIRFSKIAKIVTSGNNKTNPGESEGSSQNSYLDYYAESNDIKITPNGELVTNSKTNGVKSDIVKDENIEGENMNEINQTIRENKRVKSKKELKSHMEKKDEIFGQVLQDGNMVEDIVFDDIIEEMDNKNNGLNGEGINTPGNEDKEKVYVTPNGNNEFLE